LFYGYTLPEISLVEGHEVDKDEMSFMHEEITEKIKVIVLTDLLRDLYPLQHGFS
jgi:hypothetical protein